MFNLWVYYICMDKNSYPNISNLRILSEQPLSNEDMVLGELTLNGLSYFAKYRKKADILELVSFNKKYWFTPTDREAETKYVLVLDRDSNLEITLNRANDILESKVLERGNYGIHFK